MSKRTTDIYGSALGYVNKNILSLRVGTIITDFERALRYSIREIAPETKILGCWFHHVQALRRKVSLNELFALIRHNEIAKVLYHKFQSSKVLYHKFQSLALLPEEKIKPAPDQLAYEALKAFPQFEKLVQYYDKQWIRRETPKSFSVFLEVCYMIVSNRKQFEDLFYTYTYIYNPGHTNERGS